MRMIFNVTVTSMLLPQMLSTCLVLVYLFNLYSVLLRCSHRCKCGGETCVMLSVVGITPEDLYLLHTSASNPVQCRLNGSTKYVTLVVQSQ